MTPAEMIETALEEAKIGIGEGDYRSTIMVTTLAPCLYCCGLIRQFGIGTVVVGENRTFAGGIDELVANGVSITVLDDDRCTAMMTDFIAARPTLWNEDIGVADE